VTYLDVATLVRDAAAARDATKKPKKAKDAEGVIGELIIDTLHEFSGDEEFASDLGPQRGPSIRPMASSYEDPSAWGLDDAFDESPLPLAPGHAEHAPPTTRRPQSVRPRRSRVPGTVPPPPRERVQTAPEDEGSTAGGPWWRRWFG
jgi:hypothetical protein